MGWEFIPESQNDAAIYLSEWKSMFFEIHVCSCNWETIYWKVLWQDPSKINLQLTNDKTFLQNGPNDWSALLTCYQNFVECHHDQTLQCQISLHQNCFCFFLRFSRFPKTFPWLEVYWYKMAHILCGNDLARFAQWFFNFWVSQLFYPMLKEVYLMR